MAVIVAILLLGYLWSSLLDIINIRYLRARAGQGVAQDFAAWFPASRLESLVNYNRARTLLALGSGALVLGGQILVFVSGLLPWLAYNLAAWPDFWSGLLCLWLPAFIVYLASVPGSLASDFGVERRFGFSTITLGTWIGDRLKGLLISALLTGLLFWGCHLFIAWWGDWWWLAAWALVVIVSLLLSFVAPVLLMPLFNKFTPIPDRELEAKILSLAQRAGFPLSGVFQMDASKRSTHDNAFFTGLGRTRRIVFFDTMLQNYTHDELLSVMGHEIGHWKLGHIPKMLVLSALMSGVVLFSTAWVLRHPWLYQALGIKEIYKQMGLAGPVLGLALFTATVLLAPLGLLASPLLNWISRRHEYRADAFSLELHPQGEALKTALIKLGSKNLSNLFPHPLYVFFHYSHPPLGERVQAIERLAKKNR